MSISKWLSQSLMIVGKTQDELATYLGVSSTYITKIKDGHIPSADVLKKMCVFLEDEYKDIAQEAVSQLSYKYHQKLIKRYFEKENK